MKFEILNRWTEKVQFIAEIEADKNTSIGIKICLAVKWALRNHVDLTGANLSWANLSNVDLARVNLTGANLTGANLSYANLIRADLSGADLSGANLSGAKLSWTNLSHANLGGADLNHANLNHVNLSCADKIPHIVALDTKILAAIEAGGSLKMSKWHTCETTHCRAGWAITLAGEPGQQLEYAFGPSVAGAMIYAKAYPDLLIPNFYATNDETMADLKFRAAIDVNTERQIE